MRRLRLLLIVACVIFLCGFENKYFTITESDVQVVIPKKFPKPVYDLEKNKITPEGFILGRKLFHDPILSRDSSTSCASCHQRFAAFAHIDHALAHGINGLIGKRNVPAIQNMIWQKTFMWDGGINHLDLQPIAPIQNPLEMDETLEGVIAKLQRDSTYSAMFKRAFGDSLISTKNLMKSLSQFIALMISDDSKYDKYERGEETYSESELSGLKIFRSKCSSCHKEPLFTDESFRSNGLFPDTAIRDSGRYVITGKKTDLMRFKVPSLRNVEMTHPYMHDGRFKNLEQVLNHYSNGKYFGENLDNNMQKISRLNEKEKSDIIAFLKTLTDKTFLYDRRFADPNGY